MDLEKLLKCITIGGTKLGSRDFCWVLIKVPKTLPEKAQLCTRVEALGGVGGRWGAWPSRGEASVGLRTTPVASFTNSQTPTTNCLGNIPLAEM